MKKAGAKRKKILNTKTLEIVEGLRELCLKENINMPNLSNKLNGKINNNTSFLFVEDIYPTIENPYKAKNGREFNILKVYNYIDRYGGGDIAIVEMIDNKSKHIIKDEVLANYLDIPEL
jgi:hypothetical protein